MASTQLVQVLLKPESKLEDAPTAENRLERVQAPSALSAVTLDLMLATAAPEPHLLQ